MRPKVPNPMRAATTPCLQAGHTYDTTDEKSRWMATMPPANFVWFFVLMLIGLPLTRAEAQQDWPPDDPNNGQSPYPQQYSQPSYGQPQYAQPQYQPNQQYANGNQSYSPSTPYAQPGYSQPNNYTEQPYSAAQQGYGQQALSPDQLDQLVAPIALYPDNLVAEILAASTYPAQVVAADEWLRAQGNSPPEQIVAGANAQTSWDPSVKALTAFPQVLAMMDHNLQWTTNLGNAYYNQPQDVLQTIQVMRERAEQAGNLQNTPQTEVNNDQGYIDVAPTNPDMVYVPSYDPWAVYGQPVSPYPGFSLLGAIGSFFGNSLVNYGPGIAMRAFMSTPWGWLGWGLDWLAHAVLFNHGDYFTNSRSVSDWGFPHGGPRFYPGRPDWGRGGERSNWARGSDRNGWNRGGYEQAHENQGFRQGYGEPRGGPVQRWNDARTQEGFNRGYPSRRETYGRPTLPSQSYSRSFEQNRGYAQYGRQQAYAGRSSGYGSNYGSRPFGRQEGNFGGRAGMSYGTSLHGYVTPENSFRGSDFGSGRSYGGSPAFQSRPQHSGGFHLFGGGHSNEYKAPKGFGGGRSGWGGGFRVPKPPKASHFGGGGHSFGGGGHHFGGGGHSGGGGHGHHR
ncbi:MAG TPA: DUF3300 domain-containing protein [Terracidiphilus sp.]|nr:DUF3300 domain-containing protein [Terracidiphilus sp.]